jgi:hypothetical protein
MASPRPFRRSGALLQREEDVMEPIEVKIANDHVVGYACPACCAPCGPFTHQGLVESSIVWALKESKRAAENHCDPKCNDCKMSLIGVTPWVGGVCDACYRVRRQKETQAKYEAAEKIPEAEYQGYLVVEGCDEYFETADDLAETCLDTDTEYPQWAWAVTTSEFRIDADDIIDQELEQHHDEAEVRGPARLELKTFLDAWCKRQGVTTLWPDYRRVIILEPRKMEAEEDE